MHPYQLTEDELLDVIGVNVRPSSRPPRYAEEDQLDDGRDDDGEPEELNFD